MQNLFHIFDKKIKIEKSIPSKMKFNIDVIKEELIQWN